MHQGGYVLQRCLRNIKHIDRMLFRDDKGVIGADWSGIRMAIAFSFSATTQDSIFCAIAQKHSFPLFFIPQRSISFGLFYNQLDFIPRSSKRSSGLVFADADDDIRIFKRLNPLSESENSYLRIIGLISMVLFRRVTSIRSCSNNRVKFSSNSSLSGRKIS